MEDTMESLVDEDHADRLRTRLTVLCNNKDFCDVVLTSADGCDIQAHWLVLASSSEYFAAMKYSPIIYTDIDISELSIIVNYIYTGKVAVIPDKKEKLILGSKKLQLNSLESLILSASNTITSDQQSSDNNEVLESLPNLDAENQHKQSPSLLHVWTKHYKSGTGISLGQPGEGSAGTPVEGQCRSDGCLVQFPDGMVKNFSPDPVSLPVSQAYATQSHPGNHPSLVESHPVSWNWDPQSLDMADRSINEMDTDKLVENVDFKIKEEVLSEEENDFSFFAPAESDQVQDSVQSEASFHGGPAGGSPERKRRNRGERKTGSRVVSETVSSNNEGENKETDQGVIVPSRQKGVDLLLGGFKYNKKRVNKNKTISWRCRHTGCQATATTDEDGQLLMKGKDHSHETNTGMTEAHLITSAMRKRAREELTSIPKIYEDERKKILSAADATPQAVASNLQLYESIKSSLYRERAKKVPQTPKSAASIQLDGEWRQTHTCHL